MALYFHKNTFLQADYFQSILHHITGLKRLTIHCIPFSEEDPPLPSLVYPIDPILVRLVIYKQSDWSRAKPINWLVLVLNSFTHFCKWHICKVCVDTLMFWLDSLSSRGKHTKLHKQLHNMIPGPAPLTPLIMHTQPKHNVWLNQMLVVAHYLLY